MSFFFILIYFNFSKEKMEVTDDIEEKNRIKKMELYIKENIGYLAEEKVNILIVDDINNEIMIIL
jgi:hypothetical protein